MWAPMGAHGNYVSALVFSLMDSPVPVLILLPRLGRGLAERIAAASAPMTACARHAASPSSSEVCT